ncbi:MAG: transposase [Gallionella sp.]|nr:transposase [Gallionella sp.]
MNYSPSIRSIRRQHASEFKRGLVALCQPGASVSAVALANGVNANLLRRWINQFRSEQSSCTNLEPARLVAVQVDSSVEAQANDVIEINIQKRGAQISIRWPGNQAHAFGQWLAVWLK